MAGIGATYELEPAKRTGGAPQEISLPDPGLPVLLQVPPLLDISAASPVKAVILDHLDRTLVTTTVLNGSLTGGNGRGGLLLLEASRVLTPGEEYVLRVESLGSAGARRSADYPFRVSAKSK